MVNKINPKWSIEQAIQVAKEAIKLVEPRRRQIEPRVTAGLLDELPNYISQLEALLTGRPAKITQVKGLTGAEAENARNGAAWISAVRDAVKKRAPHSGLAKAVGVGVPVNVARSSSVASAIEAILKAASENPDGIHACGILDGDIQNGAETLQELLDARNNQDLGMKDKKDLTTEKNIIQIKVEKAVEEISTAGYLELMKSEPLIAERFRELPPYKGTRKKKTTGQVPIELPRKEREVSGSAS